MATTNCVKYREGYKYHIADDMVVMSPILGYSIDTDWIRLFPTGWLLLKKGYASDGPSGPTIDTKSFMRGAFAHDALYQFIREGLLPESTRNLADVFLHDLCIVDGMWEIRAAWVYLGVALCGDGAILPSSGKEILIAP